MSSLPKLVRDNIPELIIKNENKISVIRELSFDEYRMQLFKKLQEEANEVITAEGGEHRLEELADLMELIKAIAALDNATLDHVELLRIKKAEERGGFERRIFLEEILEG